MIDDFMFGAGIASVLWCLLYRSLHRVVEAQDMLIDRQKLYIIHLEEQMGVTR